MSRLMTERSRSAGLFLAIAFGLLLAVAAQGREPTEQEQYFVELINRARLDPEAEVIRLGTGDLNEGPPTLGPDSWTIVPEPACEGRVNCFQPLAINPNLVGTASDYATALNDADLFGHEEFDTNPQSRMAAGGYVAVEADFDSPSGVAQYTGDYGASTPNMFIPGRENLAFRAEGPANGAIDDLTDAVALSHEGLFNDFTVPGRGHRSTMMYGEFQEIGVGVSEGLDLCGPPPGEDCDSLYIVTNFAHRSDNVSFVTGVAYVDLDQDGFYTPDIGEPLAGLTVEVFDVNTSNLVTSTTTFASGGYSVEVEKGIYDIVFSGMGYDSGEDFFFLPIVGTGPGELGENVKLDFVPVPEPSSSQLHFAALIALAVVGRRAKRRTTPAHRT